MNLEGESRMLISIRAGALPSVAWWLWVPIPGARDAHQLPQHCNQARGKPGVHTSWKHPLYCLAAFNLLVTCSPQM